MLHLPPELFGDLPAYTIEALGQFPGTGQGCIYMRQDIIRSNVFDERRLLQQLCGLVACAAQQKRPARCPQPPRQRFQSMKAGGVYSSHISQS